MINKLIKQFNLPLDKIRNNEIKSTTFTNGKYSIIKSGTDFILYENQLKQILISFFKSIFILISKPLFYKSGNELTIKFVYYIPAKVISEKSLKKENIKTSDSRASAFLSTNMNKDLLSKINSTLQNHHLTLPRQGMAFNTASHSNIEELNKSNLTKLLVSKDLTLRNLDNATEILSKQITLNYLENLNKGASTFIHNDLKSVSKEFRSKYNERANAFNTESPLGAPYIGEGPTQGLGLQERIQSLPEMQLRSKFKFISMVVSKVLNINVSIEATRIKFPQFDSHIFSQYLALKSFSWSYSRMKKFIKIIPVKTPLSLARTTKNDEELESINTNNNTVSSLGQSLNIGAQSSALHYNNVQESRGVPVTSLMGVNLKVAGRLHKQKITPKKTIKRTNKGPSAPSSILASQSAVYTGKNKKGSFSIKIVTGHSLRES